MMYDVPHSPIHLSPQSHSHTYSNQVEQTRRRPDYPSPARSDAGSFSNVPDALGIFTYSTADIPTTPQSCGPSPLTTGSFWDPSLTTTSFDTLTSPGTHGWQPDGSAYSNAATSNTLQSSQDWRPVTAVSNYHGFTSESEHYSKRVSNSPRYSPSEMYPMETGDMTHPQLVVKVENDFENGWYSGPATIPGYTAAAEHQPAMTVSPPHLDNFPMTPYPSNLFANLLSSTAYDRQLAPRSSHSTPGVVSDSGMLSDGNSAPEMSPEQDDDAPVTDIQRRRTRRRMTGADDANFECPECNKYFHRSYNFKQHKATHDPARQKPHVCPYQDCLKSFVRKTDLDRHDTSVHKKVRRYMCDRCHAQFARKDTLRRHYEDGCPRRTEYKHAPHHTTTNPHANDSSMFYRPASSSSNSSSKNVTHHSISTLSLPPDASLPEARLGSTGRRRNNTDKLDPSMQASQPATRLLTARQNSVKSEPVWN